MSSIFYCRVLLDLLVCLDLLALLVADTTSPDTMSTELISQLSEPRTMKWMPPSSLLTLRLRTFLPLRDPERTLHAPAVTSSSATQTGAAVSSLVVERYVRLPPLSEPKAFEQFPLPPSPQDSTGLTPTRAAPTMPSRSSVTSPPVRPASMPILRELHARTGTEEQRRGSMSGSERPSMVVPRYGCRCS